MTFQPPPNSLAISDNEFPCNLGTSPLHEMHSFSANAAISCSPSEAQYSSPKLKAQMGFSPVHQPKTKSCYFHFLDGTAGREGLKETVETVPKKSGVPVHLDESR